MASGLWLMKIVKRLQQFDLHHILLRLKEGLTERDLKKGQLHKVFEDSFDAKPIYHRSFSLQKINYIHLNAVRGKWKLVEHWRDYEHSSARFYERNKIDGFVPEHFEVLSQL